MLGFAAATADAAVPLDLRLPADVSQQASQPAEEETGDLPEVIVRSRPSQRPPAYFRCSACEPVTNTGEHLLHIASRVLSHKPSQSTEASDRAARFSQEGVSTPDNPFGGLLREQP